MKKLVLATLPLLCLGAVSSAQAQDASLMKGGMPEPKAVGAVPTEAQMAWQHLETYAFVHFGLNTFNDLEWGYGNTPASTFNPKKLDTDQWVRTLKAAGMKAVILTAKHHDGFCLWPTKTVDYSVKNSPWLGGKGDLVKSLSESCRKYGLKFGLYLSPWDRHNAEYAREGYQKIFHDQIRELTSNYGELFEYWFDGANGGTGWYGGADEARSINPKEYYMYEEASEILRKNNPNIMIFGGTVPTIRWIGNEQGWAGETNWSAYSTSEEKHYRENIWGHREGKEWLPGEVDVSIRPGWFYHHREDHQVRSVANLTNIYYQSVGRNANLLLNFPVNLDGVIPRQDSINIVRWHEHIVKSFKNNLLKGARVEAEDTRLGDKFVPAHLVDGKDNTYWATMESKTPSIVFTLGKKEKLNNILLQEYIRLGQRVEGFTLESRAADGSWQAVDTRDSLTTIGYKRIIRISPVETDAIRLKITKSKDVPCLAEVAAYLAPELVDAPEAYRNEADQLIIRGVSPRHKLSYRIGKGKWQSYTGSVQIPSDHVTVSVMADSGTDKAEKTIRFGYSAKNIQVDSLPAAQHKALFDGNGYTTVRFKKAESVLNFNLSKPSLVSSFVYTPTQHRDAQGHIQKYRLYADNQLVAEGEFQNIKANPIPVEVRLKKPVRTQKLRLEVVRVLDDKDFFEIGDIAFM